MNFILGISVIGTVTSIYLGLQFIANGRKTSNANYYLGILFMLIALRIGKFLIQELAAESIQSMYFNVMHASYLALGPIVWFYIRSHFSLAQPRPNKIVHLAPALVLLLTAFSARHFLGESIWIWIYWMIQVHPLFYVISSWKSIKKEIDWATLSISKSTWLYSILGSVLLIASMNALYFVFLFPFYLVTSSLIVLTCYLIISMAFSGKLNAVLRVPGKKYKNLRLSSEEITQIWNKAWILLTQDDLFLNENLKLAHLSNQLNTSQHIVSMVINTCSGKNFSDLINSMRIERAQQKIAEEKGKKILAVALESGFTSLSAFNRAFKKNTGLKPSEYRSKIS